MFHKKTKMPDFWKTGDNVLLRGMYEDHPVYMQSLRVVKDTPEETTLFIWPGAECVAPSAYIHHGHAWNQVRWQETLNRTLKLERYFWHTNSFLILLEPQKYFSTIYIWSGTPGRFIGYYINFQLPFCRTPLGFDTLDLDLDMVVDPSFEWEWKDEVEYRDAIRVGGIRPAWVVAVERAKVEIFERIEKRDYPLNASWLNFRPDPSCTLPYLPQNWNEAYS